MRPGRWTNVLIVFYGTTGIALLAGLGVRQRIMLKRIVSVGDGIESMLLQVEQESRATAHILGANIEVDPDADIEVEP